MGLWLGEAEAIALAIEYNCVAVLDDRIARSKAKSMWLKVIDTIGLLRRAYDKELVDKDGLIQTLKQLKNMASEYPNEIVREVLDKLE